MAGGFLASEEGDANEGGEGDIETGEGIDLSDPGTWPTPPGTDPESNREQDHPREKNRRRGEKVIVDGDGNIWTPHPPDDHHEEGHWDRKGPHWADPWENVDIEGQVIPNG